eukprot:SAG11_NODE_1651_length_4509_cov_3.919274_2_plen_44_part_00
MTDSPVRLVRYVHGYEEEVEVKDCLGVATVVSKLLRRCPAPDA